MLSVPDNPRILLTNDDGIDARGLRVLHEIATSLSDDVWTCAPAFEMSGTSHSISLHRPLRLVELDEKTSSVDGTPSDCVLVACRQWIPRKMGDRGPDLVLSGVNRGVNICEDVTYSGTIGAAMEAVLLGVPAIALSLELRNTPPCWQTPLAFAPDLLRRLLEVYTWHRSNLLSINFPGVPPDKIKGTSIERQGLRPQEDELIERKDPRGRPYLWISGRRETKAHVPEGSDAYHLAQDRIVVTPMAMDLTDEAALTKLQEHFWT
ncbi:MAG: 5'/3'-nucleotidase SurE [Pseudomonadota bacterium]